MKHAEEKCSFVTSAKCLEGTSRRRFQWHVLNTNDDERKSHEKLTTSRLPQKKLCKRQSCPQTKKGAHIRVSKRYGNENENQRNDRRDGLHLTYSNQFPGGEDLENLQQDPRHLNSSNDHLRRHQIEESGDRFAPASFVSAALVALPLFFLQTSPRPLFLFLQQRHRGTMLAGLR